MNDLTNQPIKDAEVDDHSTGVHADAAAECAVVDVARTLAYEAVLSFWNQLVKMHGKGNATLDVVPPPVVMQTVRTELAASARTFGEEVAHLPLTKAVAELGKFYSHMLPGSHRSRNGVFYTPPALVERMLDKATEAGVDWTRAKVISPACGAGQFLVHDALRMAMSMGLSDPALIVASVGNRLRGWDLDPFSCWMAQILVEASVLPQVLASGKRLATVTECRDSLMFDLDDHAGRYDLVNENPAFGKVPSTDEIRSRYGRSIYGHPNLYGMFADLSVTLCRKGGVVCLLTPASFLGGKYFGNLRNTLRRYAPPVHIELVESRRDVFPDVLQEVVLSTFKAGGKNRTFMTSVLHVDTEGLRVENTGKSPVSKADAPWVIARSRDEAPLVASFAKLPFRLKDWGYKVATGPLVWNRADKAGRLHAEAGASRVPVIWSDSVSRNGKLDLRLGLGSKKRFYDPKRNGGAIDDANVVRRPCLLLQRTTAKEQSRRLIGAMLPVELIDAHGAVAVENHLNMIVPIIEAPPVPIDVVAAFFASQMADRVIRCINGSVAVSASEIESMPLPSPDVILSVMATGDSEAGLNRIYGVIDGGRIGSSGRKNL